MLTLIGLLVAKARRSQATRLVVLGCACLLAGAVAFSLAEHVSFGTALYWAVTTATTVGYGDVTPKNTLGRVIASATMLTTIPLLAAAFALFAGAVAATRLRRILGMEHRAVGAHEVMIFGAHPSVARIAAQLVRAGRDVAVVAAVDRSTLPDAVRVISADPTSEEALRRSHPERAEQLLITGSSDADVLVSAVLLRRVAPQVPALAVASSGNVAQALSDLGVGASVSADDLLAATLTKSLEAPHAGELLLRLVDSQGYRLTERPVAATDQGRPLSEVRSAHAGLVLGAVHGGSVVLGVEQDPTLAAGDSLLVVEAEQA